MVMAVKAATAIYIHILSLHDVAIVYKNENGDSNTGRSHNIQ